MVSAPVRRVPTMDRLQLAEELLHHQSFLTAIARRLVGDHASADDLVQQVNLAALERPPRHAGALPAWLSVAARRMAGRIRLGDQRRRARESAHDHPHAVESADDAMERLQIRRVVVDELMELDEPYRSTLVLRYFDDLKPSQIAQRQGVPLATVKSRIQRGVSALRSRIAARCGGIEPSRRQLMTLAMAAPPVGATAATGARHLTSSAWSWSHLLGMVAAVLVVGWSVHAFVSPGVPRAGEAASPGRSQARRRRRRDRRGGA